MKKQKERTLKIYRKFRPTKRKERTVPEIRLCGNWLEQLGFVQGKQISIASQKKRLIIVVSEQ